MPEPEPQALEAAKDYRERYKNSPAVRCGSAQSVTKVACVAFLGDAQRKGMEPYR
jgi:hypothetical protein